MQIERLVPRVLRNTSSEPFFFIKNIINVASSVNYTKLAHHPFYGQCLFLIFALFFEMSKWLLGKMFFVVQ